jgi:uncharacterized protein (TIGR00375 family)
MRCIADLHLHSKYSRAVSQEMNCEHIASWADRKGIAIVGTGDFTHPEWFREIQAKLTEHEEGLFSLRDGKSKAYFLLATELSCIYSQGGKGRRIHVVVLAPTLKAVEAINAQLGWQGNLKSDGRPILGMSAVELTKIVLDASPDCLVIPAHVWTPWFSLFGSMSGFDSLEECFGTLSKHIVAIETGLSSDPPMNWRLSQLDGKQIVSFSDAHSGANLGREATVFEVETLSYQSMAKALRMPDEKNRIESTIEFFPEEGKYHWDGHRACGIRWSPAETKTHKGVCPTCGKRVTVGVANRVEELADRPEGYEPPSRPPYTRLVPLAEIIGEALGVGKLTKSVLREYDQLLNTFGSEFSVLLDASLDEIRNAANPRIADGIARVRGGTLHILPGYDGEFGTVRVFADGEQRTGTRQGTLL